MQWQMKQEKTFIKLLGFALALGVYRLSSGPFFCPVQSYPASCVFVC
jgi:hypothetical protein